MAYHPADVRLEILGEDAACFHRDSGVTHIMDAGGTAVLQQIIDRPGISRDQLLTDLVASFEDDAKALETLLDNALVLLAQQDLVWQTEVPDAPR